MPTAAVPSGPLGSRTTLAGRRLGRRRSRPSRRLPRPSRRSRTAPRPTGRSSPIAAARGGSGPDRAASGRGRAGGGREVLGPGRVALLARGGGRAVDASDAPRVSVRQVLTASGPKGKGQVYRVRVGPYRVARTTPRERPRSSPAQEKRQVALGRAGRHVSAPAARCALPSGSASASFASRICTRSRSVDARERAAHGLRRGALPQPRRVFLARHGDLPPARRRLHAGLRLLRHRERQAAPGRRAGARPGARGRAADVPRSSSS